jgi:hypothetical protein
LAEEVEEVEPIPGMSICLIVFFVMARNIGAIARSAKATEKLLNKI